MRPFFLLIALCLCPMTAFAAGSSSLQDYAGAAGRDYAQASSCPASGLARVLKLPKRPPPPCKDAFKEMGYACSLVGSTCDDCENATSIFNEACSTKADLNSDTDCDTDSDCALVDTDCNTRYDPTPLNRFKTIAARRRNGWPMDACMRNRDDMKKFHAVCSSHSCQVQKDDKEEKDD